jgi:hypothetical protein
MCLSSVLIRPRCPRWDLYIRFRLTSDQLVSFPAYQGVAVDNVKITR